MPITLAAVSNDLLGSTLYDLMDELRDQLYQKNAFLDNARKLGGVETHDGGTTLVMPIGVRDHTVVTNHITGWEPQGMVFNDIMDQAQYSWSHYSAPIGINAIEERMNKGEKAQLKIVEQRAKNAMSMLTRGINTQIIAGGALAGTPFVNLLTLNGEAVATGFLENHAWGTGGGQTNTVGGLAKAVIDVNGWYNQRQTCASAFGTAATDGVRLMNQIRDDANAQAQSGEIKAVLMSRAAMANYKRALYANERFIDEKSLNGGRQVLQFGNAVVEQELEMPVNAGVGTDEFSAYFLNFDSVKLHVLEGGDFEVGPVIPIPAHNGRYSTLQVSCQLAANHLSSVGVLVDGDTW